MRIGRVTKHWNRNCLAVGLSQGFIEPLEATALLFIQKSALGIVEFLQSGDFSDAAHDRYNQRVNEHFEGTRDYIVTHYKTNSRTDTEYWRANAANRNLSEPLKRLLNRWMSGNNIVGEINALGSASAYPVFSWYCIMAGMGIFPDAETLRPASGREKQFSIAEIQNLLSRGATNFRDHRTVLQADTAAPHGGVAADLLLVTSAQAPSVRSRCSFAMSSLRTRSLASVEPSSRTPRL